MKVDFKKQNVRTLDIFYESTGLTEANFLHPLAKLCVQDAGRTPKKITVYIYIYIYLFICPFFFLSNQHFC